MADHSNMQEARAKLNTFSMMSWPRVLYKTPADQFTTWYEEEAAWNYTASVWDAGEDAEGAFMRITGPDAANLLSDLCVNRVHGSKPGTIKNLVICREDGKVACDTMCLVYGENEFEITLGGAHVRYAMTKKQYDVNLEMIPSRTMIQVAGPNAFKILGELTDDDLTQIKFAHFGKVTLCGVEAILVRVTMTGELGFEVQANLKDHDLILGRIMEVGAKYGVRRIGIKNHLVQHLEGGLSGTYYCDMATSITGDEDYYNFCKANFEESVLLGRDKPAISGSYEPESYEDFMMSPVDLGLARLINFDHDFVGKEALAEEVKNPKRKFVCLEWNSEDVIDVYASWFKDGPSHERCEEPHYDYMELPRDTRLPIEASKVLADGKEIAFTTSRTYLYTYRRMISNCVIPIEYSEPGTKVTIIWGEPGHPQKEIRATVASSPYKPNHTRSLPSDAKK